MRTRTAPAGVPPTAPGRLAIRRLAWAGIQLSLDGADLFIDPWTDTAIWDGAWSGPVPEPARTGEVAAVALTHLHNDHFDPATIARLLRGGGPTIVHAPLAASVAGRGLQVRAVSSGTAVEVGPFTLLPVPTEDGLGEDQVGWVVRAGSRRVLHAGDALWHGRWGRIGRAHGPFDVAFLPINGARIPSLMPPGTRLSMGPEEAIAAAGMLDARIVVPIHFGLHDPGAYEEAPDPLGAFEAAARQVGRTVRVMDPGEWWSPEDR